MKSEYAKELFVDVPNKVNVGSGCVCVCVCGAGRVSAHPDGFLLRFHSLRTRRRFSAKLIQRARREMNCESSSRQSIAFVFEMTIVHSDIELETAVFFSSHFCHLWLHIYGTFALLLQFT